MRALLVAPVVLVAAACTPERPPPVTTPPVEETRGPSPTTEPLPASAPPDAGAPAAEPPAGETADETTTPEATATTPASAAKARVYDRLIAKLNAPKSFDEAALKAAIESETGAKVAEINKGAIGLLSIVFVPTDPPRSEAEQRALVEKLKGLSAFKYVEPDRLMQAK